MKRPENAIVRDEHCEIAGHGEHFGSYFSRAFSARLIYVSDMTIWIMAALLFALFGALGYAKGAIRMIFPLMGLALGTFLAVPLGPTVKPLVPLVGLKNPIWSILLPPVIIFFLIAIVFIVIGFIVHWKVSLHYKYSTDDYTRLAWERLNKRLGVSMGLIAGSAYTLLLGLVIYILGYLTVQVSAGENETGLAKNLNQARSDLHSSGLAKTVAVFDPTPENYYLASDILGLVYHNPLLHGRLSTYPPFLALAERQQFQDIATDTEFQNMLATQTAFGQIINHPKTQAILNDQDIIQQLQQTDLKDLLEYLKTGESPKFADIRILGRWQLEPYATLLQEKKRRSHLTTAEMKLLRQQFEFVKSYTLVVTPDSNVKLKGPDVMPLVQKYLGELKAAADGTTKRAAPVARAAAPAPAPVQPTGRSAANQQLMQRYGNRPGASPTAPPAATVTPVPAAAATAPVPSPSPAAIAAEIAKLPTVILAEGTWKGENDKYQLTLTAQAGGFRFGTGKKSATVEASLKDGRLYLAEENETMVMEKF